jgi:hypothetical protein
MSDPNSQETSQHMLPVVAAFLGVSMSVLFSQLALSNIAFMSILGPGCLSTILAIIFSYFLVFYSVSKALYSQTISIYHLLTIFGISILMIFIGMSDIRGMFIRILLWALVAGSFGILWKAEIGRIQYWYCIPFVLLAFSTVYSLTSSGELLIEDEDVWLEDIEDNRNGITHATLFLRMKASKYDANSIMVKIICSDQFVLDENECALHGIDILEEDEERVVEWDIVFEGAHTHSVFLYLVSSGRISNRKITIHPEDGQWKADIEYVGYLDNLSIFLKNNHLLTL